MNFPIHDLTTAPAGSQPLLQAVKGQLGFVPGVYGALAESPAALQGALSLADSFGKSGLSAAEQQVVALATSVENDCAFCVAVHSTIARHMVKVPSPVVDALRAGGTVPDAKLAALTDFVRATVSQRGLTTEVQRAAFLAAGYTKAQAMDVLLGVAMKTLANYASHLADPPVNDAFKNETWDKSLKKAA